MLRAEGKGGYENKRQNPPANYFELCLAGTL